MKKLYTVMLVVLLLCVTGTVVFLVLSPDRVPVHYGLDGKSDQIGSKYVMAVFPVLIACMAGLFMMTGRIQRKKAEASNEKVILLVGIFTMIFLTLTGFYFMLIALRYTPGTLSDISDNDINRFIGIGVGVLLVLFGNIMPKTRRNSAVGIRTKWSLANDTVWQKSQRFGGIAAVISGFCMIILSLFISGIGNTVMMLAIITLMAVISSYASYRYYKEDTEN